MMCDCIKQIEEKMFQSLTDIGEYKKPIEKVEMQGKVLALGKQVELKIVTNFDITLVNQKKKMVMPMANSFCQFCGESLK